MVKNLDTIINIELVSIHIPKTGGSSFYEVLKHVYGSSLDPRTKRKDFFSNPALPEQSIDLYQGKKAIHGHLHYSEVKHIVDRNKSVKLITWLRDPVERVISHYFFFINRIHEGKVKPQQNHKINFTLLEFARLESSRNVICKFLKGVDLNDFYFIGHIEKFQADLRLLSEKMNWPFGIQPHHVNKRNALSAGEKAKTKFKTITDAMRKEISELNREDTSLYNKSLEFNYSCNGRM